MPPGGGGEDGCTKQDHPPAADRRRDEDAPPLPTPPFPTVALQVYQRRKKQRQLKQQQQAAASIPEGPLALCSDPDIRKRSPQTLSGFFHNQHTEGNDLKFRNLSGKGPPLVDPSLPFLCGYERFMVKQCCGGLLLCICWEFCDDHDDYDLVVCNPATGKWTVLPPIVLWDEEDGGHVCFPCSCSDVFLGFDTASPSCFVVLVPLEGCVDDVAIYSSETEQWIRGGSEDRAVPIVTDDCVFLNGFMHLIVDDFCIVAVDAEGEDWNCIPLPEPEDDVELRYGNSSMGQSQGLLHVWYTDPEDDHQLYVWVLEDYDNEEWTLKHTVDLVDLFDTDCEGKYPEMFAIHPEWNLIFVTNGQDTTLSYNMDNEEVNVMCTSGEFLEGLPYIPCFADWLSDGQ